MVHPIPDGLSCIYPVLAFARCSSEPSGVRCPGQCLVVFALLGCDTACFATNSTVPDQAELKRSTWCVLALPVFPYNLRFPGQYYQAETGLNQNWNRDYDPVVGRYIESDLIGLYGGINTYAYVYDDPVGAFDPEGLVKRGDGWSNPQWVRIKAAEATIRQEASKSCSCSGGSCIPCELVPRLLDKLNNSEIVEAPLGGDCGFAGPGYRVFLSPVAFTKRCDCLASTMYHELLHNAGLEHYATPAGPGIEDLEKRCLGHLCKGSSQ